MFDWIVENQHLAWLGALSLLTFIGSLVTVPVLLIRMPADYFLPDRRVAGEFRQQHPVIRLVLLAGKNVLGLVLILAGIAMLVLPGQGVLTLLIGLLMLNFPGKYRLERRLILHPRVLPVVNTIRNRWGHASLEHPGEL